MEEQKQQECTAQTQELLELGASTTKSSRGNIYTLTIIGQIEGHQVLPETVKTTKYEHVIPLLAAVEESEEIDGLLLLLNTVGGDIEAGLAIAELIAGMKKPTVSLVLGGGHSIGIPLAVSAKRAIIAPRASMTVHPVRMTGLVVGAPQTYHYFDQIQDHIVDFVTENSRISRADFARYMMATGNMATDVGTVLYGAEAVESGLMDQLGSLSDALAYLHAQIAQKKKKRSGPDAGGDSVGLTTDPFQLGAFLGDLARENSLPNTILYNLNPADNAVLSTMAVNFAPKVQFGAAWWFNDTIRGMRRQIDELMENGLLAKSVGMLTDSRSFSSFPRHEYYRRILCQRLGELAEGGQYPADERTLGQIVENICGKNAAAFLQLCV